MKTLIKSILVSSLLVSSSYAETLEIRKQWVANILSNHFILNKSNKLKIINNTDVTIKNLIPAKTDLCKTGNAIAVDFNIEKTQLKDRKKSKGEITLKFDNKDLKINIYLTENDLERYKNVTKLTNSYCIDNNTYNFLAKEFEKNSMKKNYRSHEKNLEQVYACVYIEKLLKNVMHKVNTKNINIINNTKAIIKNIEVRQSHFCNTNRILYLDFNIEKIKLYDRITDKNDIILKFDNKDFKINLFEHLPYASSHGLINGYCIDHDTYNFLEKELK